MINKNAMVRVEEVMETLGVAQDTAYKLIRKLNDELEDMGYIVVSGRLPRKFWEERFYGGADALYINNGLENQICDFVKSHPDTNLVIIDTLQKVREIGSDKYCYASDYEIFWSCTYCCIYKIAFPLLTGEKLNFREIVSSLVMGHFHMWYLYMIIGLYLITPFLRTFIKKKNKNQIYMYVVISLLAQFTQPVIAGISLKWNMFSYLVDFIQKFHLDFFYGYVTYYILGWCIVNFTIKSKKRIYLLGTMSLVLTMVYVFFTQDYSNGYSNMNIFILTYSVAVFIALNNGKNIEIGDKARSIIVTLSKLSFGVYIVHPIVQNLFTMIFNYSGSTLLYILFYYIVVVAISFVGCFIVSKIPVIRKSIRG